MIEKFLFKKDTIYLVDKTNLVSDKNIFSILVGKNGTGKSTILGEIATQTISIKTLQDPVRRFHKLVDFITSKDPMEAFPSEIITVSTSPFDKFPIYKNKYKDIYTYLGFRNISTFDIGLGYMSRIITSLMESILNNNIQSKEISYVLEFLGYKDSIEIIVEFTINPQELINAINIYKDKRSKVFDNNQSNKNKIHQLLSTEDYEERLDEKKLKRIKEIITSYFLHKEISRKDTIVIDENGFFNKSSEDIENIIYLFKIGLLKLKDTKLLTRKKSRKYSIKKASSGEQSIILSVLGIASRIKNNCLILIDEPETCLHPQWQETYIEILIKTFNIYKNCHFIIATHSPLIVARLPKENSYIIDLEYSSIQNAENFINHSSDFQLANVFNYPGFKNEYLLRISINLFSNISKNKNFSEEDNLNFLILKEQSKFLRINDPVFDLYETIAKLKLIYG